jgi:hypothetical protein
MTDDRAAYIRALIAHRCPEIEPEDLAALADTASTEAIAPPAEMLPVEIGERIVEVLDLMMGRLDEIAETIANRDEDDDDATRRRAG